VGSPTNGGCAAVSVRRHQLPQFTLPGTKRPLGCTTTVMSSGRCPRCSGHGPLVRQLAGPTTASARLEPVVPTLSRAGRIHKPVVQLPSIATVDPVTCRLAIEQVKTKRRRGSA
jgi:hypothetical protein